MKKNRIAIVFEMFVLAIVLAACEAGCMERWVEEAAYPCAFDEIEPVVDLTPRQGAVVTTMTPTLSWIRQSFCKPPYYEVVVATDASFSAESIILTGNPAEQSLNWPADQPLQPGNTYYWRVGPMAPVPDEEGIYRVGQRTSAYFHTGPMCAPGTALMAPELLSPVDGAYLTELTVNLVWDDPTACLHDGDYLVEISSTIGFPPDRTYSEPTSLRTNLMIEEADPDFALEDCKRYLWRVKADLAGDDDGPYSETWMFMMNVVGSCPSLSEPPEEPTSTPSPEPSGTVTESAFCRAGPQIEHPAVDIFSEGQTLQIIGRNEESTWWWVLSPNLQQPCWISTNIFEVLDDTSQVQIVQAFPLILPTDTPKIVNCRKYTTYQTCAADPACKWNTSNPKVGVCKNR